MNKAIAILLAFLYLSFTTGALLGADRDILSYEAALDGKCGEKNESETKGIETLHLQQFAKSWSGSKLQSIRQSLESDKAVSNAICSTNTQLTSYNNSVIIDYPLFLKNKVFRL